jgi:hypothetical protein
VQSFRLCLAIKTPLESSIFATQIAILYRVKHTGRFNPTSTQTGEEDPWRVFTRAKS